MQDLQKLPAIDAQWLLQTQHVPSKTKRANIWFVCPRSNLYDVTHTTALVYQTPETMAGIYRKVTNSKW